MLRQFFNDERSSAEVIFKKGFSDNEFKSYEAYLVAKYFRNELGYKDQKVKSSLVNFCQIQDRTFNYILNRDVILSIVSNSSSEWKDKTHPIFITENEVTNIRKIKNFNGQKILLAFAVFAKRDNGYVYHDRWGDIKRLSGIRMTNRDIYRFLHEAYNLELIRDSNQNHFVKFLDDSTNVALSFTREKDIMKLGETYKKYLGGEIFYCKSCGKDFVKNGRNHFYCDDCSKKKDQENTRVRVNKHRNK